MGFKFRKSIKIAPGVKLNINKKSVGISAGTRGARVSVNSKGRATTTVGIPGSGISYSKTTNLSGSNGGNKKNSSNNSSQNDFSQQPQQPKKPTDWKKVGLIVLIVMFFPIICLLGIIPAILYFALWRKKVDITKRKKWDIISGVLGVISIIILANWILNPVIPAKTIEITAQTSEMDINSTQDIDIIITPENANTEIEYISENSDVITITDTGAITSTSKEGSSVIYAKSGDIESNKIEINVIDEERIAKEKAEAERLAQEEAARKAEEERLAQEEAARKAEEERLAQEQAQQAQQEYVEMVWVPANGGKYHSKSTCSGMKNPVQMTKEDAQAQGIEPCGRCY